MWSIFLDHSDCIKDVHFLLTMYLVTTYVQCTIQSTFTVPIPVECRYEYQKIDSCYIIWKMFHICTVCESNLSRIKKNVDQLLTFYYKYPAEKESDKNGRWIIPSNKWSRLKGKTRIQPFSTFNGSFVTGVWLILLPCCHNNWTKDKQLVILCFEQGAISSRQFNWVQNAIVWRKIKTSDCASQYQH